MLSLAPRTTYQSAAEAFENEDRPSDSSTSDKDDEGWEDAEPDEENIQFLSLFDQELFPSIKSMLAYCKEKYDFDFVSIQRQYKLDFLASIKLVNYIRASVKAGNLTPDVSTATRFSDDKYLQPVLEDDAVLFSLDDLGNDDGETANAKEQTPEAKIADLEAHLSTLQAQFAGFRSQVDQILERRWAESTATVTTIGEASSSKQLGPDYEGDYFHSYSYNAIHEEMLKDTVRTNAYRDFIYDNKHLFAGKIVLDVGCGTGILSMFCAKAGAARVIAVDNSDIIDKAKQNVMVNKLDNVITCIRGKIEEITLPVQEVDVIVSEWMGYCLLFEAMLDSILWARDRYLKAEGLMVPSHTVLHMAPISDEDFIEDNIEFWRDVYGFNMSAMQDKIYEDVLVRQMPVSSLAGASFPFATLDLHRVQVKDLTFVKDFQIEITKDIDSLDGWLVYFDTFFLTSRDARLPEEARAEHWSGHDGVAFTTGPQGKETHWKSGVMVIDRTKAPLGSLAAGTVVTGSIEYSKGKANARSLEIDVAWRRDGDTSRPLTKQTWFLH